MARTSDRLEHFRQLVAETIARHKLIYPGERVLAAYSGGADSNALTLLLRDLGYEVVLGHVDHGLRPESADESAALALSTKRLGFRFLSKRVRVEPPTEERARVERYAALHEMAKESGCSVIATGHTLDDQAETVAMRKQRGGFGLGMPYRRDNIVRPILDLRRSDTEEICRTAGVEFLTDPSNSWRKYTRNRIRAELKVRGDDVIRELVKEGEENRARVEATRQEALQFLEDFSRSGESVSIDRKALAALDDGLRHQVLREAASRFDVELRAAAIEDVVGKVLTVTGSALDLGPAVKVWSDKHQVMLGPGPPAKRSRETMTLLPDGEIRGGRSWPFAFRVDTVPTPDRFEESPYVEYFDAGRLQEPLLIRQWRQGDRFHPLGAPGSKKLQDLFVDMGVPAAERHDVPILESAGVIAWVIPFRIDERFKVTEETLDAVRVEVTGPPNG